MNRRGLAPALVMFVAAASLVALVGAPATATATATAAAAAGTLSTFAGGLGEGPATNLAISTSALTARNGRMVAVESAVILNPTGWSGLVRDIDLATGQAKVLAGIHIGGFRGDGGPAHQAQLSLPMDAAIDAAGNVYITDNSNSRIRKVTPAGTISTFAGNGVAGFAGEGAAATSASIKFPAGIAVSPAGDVVFADRGNNRLRQVSPSGTITTIAGTGEWRGPAGDGGPATAAVLEPWAVEFDAAGNLYVTDQAHGSLRKILTDGTITTIATPEFLPRALAVDGPGTIYLASGPGVVRIDPSGTVTTVAGAPGIPPAGAGNGHGDGGPATAAHLSPVQDLAVDGGHLYLAAASRVRRVDPSGIITTVVGNGRHDDGGDGGPALGAQFPNVARVRSGPTGTYFISSSNLVGTIHRVDPAGVVTAIYEGAVDGIAVDDTGNVFFSESQRVRKLTPAGTLSTVAGTGSGGFGGDGGPATLAQLWEPHALALDGAGNLYIDDSYNYRIRRVSPLGVITTHVGGGARDQYFTQVTLARDLAIDSVGDMAVDARGSLLFVSSDAYFKGIRKVTCGIVSIVAGTGGRSVDSLAVDAAGSVYFPLDNEIRKVDASGAATTVAGSGGSVPLEGVPARSVTLERPTGVAIHPSGRLLFGNWGRVLQVDGVTAGRTAQGAPCDTLPDRPVWGTGYNALGQMGDGTTADRQFTSGENPPLTGVTAASGGVGHSVALRTDGTVWAWGWNGYGQVGDGTTTQRLRPVPVAGLSGVVAVAGGAFHSLALKADGTVWAWGWNPLGQLGDGTTAQRNRPVQVPGLSGVVGVSAGTLHSLAVRADGSVWSWGWNGVGQLGDGTLVDHIVPARVPGLTRATGVAAGGLHSLVVKDDGSVWAWGWYLFGQLGDGTTVDHRLASPVLGLSGAKTVAAGSYHSLALRADGTVAGWGFGNVGQVGNGTTDSSLSPFTLPYLTGAVAIAAGAFHSLALTGDGRVIGWGWDYFGQLSTNDPSDKVGPHEIAALDHTAAIGAGSYHSLFAYRLVP